MLCASSEIPGVLIDNCVSDGGGSVIKEVSTYATGIQNLSRTFYSSCCLDFIFIDGGRRNLKTF